jgi:hypothetical protein
MVGPTLFRALRPIFRLAIIFFLLWLTLETVSPTRSRHIWGQHSAMGQLLGG